MSKLVELNDDNFEQIVEDNNLLLVDFWADWCGPCKMLTPILEQVADEMEGVTIGKLNVDENPASAGKYGVMSIPTLILFKDGDPVKQFVGVQNEQVLKAAIEDVA